MKDLTKGSPRKLILAFAFPVFLGNLFQLFYSLADTRIVGSLLGKDALAAVGATTSISNLIVGFLFGLTNGFAILVAMRFGEGNEKELKRSVAGTILLGMMTSILMTIIIVACLRPILRLLNTPEDLFEQTYTYIRIIFLGMTCSMLYNVCASILRAIGDSLSPLIFLIMSTILNVVLDLFLIGKVGMGVEGAAYATIISQSFSALLCVIYIHIRYPILHIKREDFRMNKTLTKKLLQSGLSMGFMNSLVSLGTVALQSSINTFGTDTIVAHAAARKLTELYMLIFTVFGTTMATYAGQNMGAGKVKRIKQGLRLVITITWVWSVAAMILTYTVGPKLIYWITKVDTPAVITTSVRYLKFNTVFYFVPAVICVFRNTMQGMGDHLTPIFSSFIELAGKVLIVILLTPRMKYDGIIISEPIVWILMVIPLIIQLFKQLKQSGREESIQLS